MRDLALLAVLAAILPLIFRAPILGVLSWIWIALMNPQREVYGFLNGAGVNFVIAAVTILAWIVSKERKNAALSPLLLLFGVFLIWTCLTTVFALEHVRTNELLLRTLKTGALVAVVAVLVNSKARIQAVIWTIALSLGYFAAKGGGFVILSGGSHRVFGPENSMIEDNNSLGLALVMLLPLLIYLRSTSQLNYVRHGVLVLIALTIAAIVGTYSRGALLALGALVVFMALRSRAGILFLGLGAAAVVAAPSVMPAAWLERMSSINSADEDASFMGRVEAWRTSFHIATERLTGGGFSSIEHDWIVQAYSTVGGLPKGRAAHSIYFQVLGDHGFIGLALFLAMIAGALFYTVLVLSATRGRPELRWANQLARMLQVSLIAYMVGGAALSMAYYDGFLILVILTAALHHTVKRGSAEVEAATSAPKWKTVEVESPALPQPSARLGPT